MTGNCGAGRAAWDGCTCGAAVIPRELEPQGSWHAEIATTLRVLHRCGCVSHDEYGGGAVLESTAMVRGTQQLRRGFSLIELVIVIVIIMSIPIVVLVLSQNILSPWLHNY